MALTNKLEAIGDAIREKTGGSEKLTLDEMEMEIQGMNNADLSEYARLSDIPSLSAYATKEYVADYVAANAGGSAESYANVFDPSTAQINTQWVNGTTKASNGIVATAKIPIKISENTASPTIIRIRGYKPWSWKDSAENIQYFDASGNYLWYAPIKNGTEGVNFGYDENGDFYVYAGWSSATAVSPNVGKYKYVALSFQLGNYAAITENDIKDIIITIDEEIKGSSAGGGSISTSPLAGKKVLVLGDSISTDAYGTYKKWVSALVDTGFMPSDVNNNSYHATGFVATYKEGGAVVQDTFGNRLSAVTDKSSYDYVIVFGGINDYIQAVPLNDFKTAVDNFFTYLTENFTNARILVLSPLRTYNVYKNTAGYYQTEYADYIRSAARSWCLPVLNLTEESGFYPFNDTFKKKWTLVPKGYSADGVHPNEEWSRKFLAPMIRKFIEAHITM